MNPPDPTDPLRVGSASASVPIASTDVWAEIELLVAELWHADTLVAEPPGLLMHSVAAEPGGEPDGWLTWTVDALSPSSSRITVTHSEQADGAPEPELEQLLYLLVGRCVQAGHWR